MRNVCLFILIFGGQSLMSVAQEQAALKFPTFGDVPSLNFKFAPLSFIEPYYHTLEGALEYKFAPKYALQLQFGYGNSNFAIYDYGEFADEAFETFRTKLEFRKYVSPFMGSLRNAHINRLADDSYKKYLLDRRKKAFPYWAIELTWKNTTFFETEFVGQSCNNGFCDYIRHGVYRLQKNLGVISFKIGKQRFYGKRFFLDYYFGLGLRYVHVHEIDQRSGFLWVPIGDFAPRIDSRTPGSFFIPGVSLGIKLGYSIALKQ